MEEKENIERLESELAKIKSISENQMQEIELLAQLLAASLSEREVELLKLPAGLQVLLRFKCEKNGKAMGY